MNPNRIVPLLIAAVLNVATLLGQQKLSREEYIRRYKGLAVEEMDIYGIPASIKMAQALLESDNGNGRLAREANNHFGIKCKSTWTGATISHDDDTAGECFRKYASVEDSYRDHSDFLDRSERYQDLFKLDPLDYKGWAYGLKQAGYATNPQYAELLIKIIEDNRLYLLDEGRDIDPQIMGNRPDKQALIAEEIPHAAPADIVDIDNYSVSVQGRKGGHTVYQNNGSQFVVLREGETLSSVAGEFGLSEKKLAKYNDFDAGTQPRPGDMVYIRAKNKRSQNGKLIHIAKDGETLHGISQMYGIRLKNLCSINRRSRDSQVSAGQQIRLM